MDKKKPKPKPKPKDESDDKLTFRDFERMVRGNRGIYIEEAHDAK